MKTNNSLQQLMKSPTWAWRVVQCLFSLSALLIGASLVPGWRCGLVRLFVGVFGFAWVIFGVFSFLFSWPFPRRYGSGFYSPTSYRHIWWIFCFLMVAVGGVCVLVATGFIVTKVRGCA
ncbi:hypothetical protein [Undibacterium sp. Ren11W]|uniref:hypothetical protein n=1 Tax=Undibacterium sp. Ren11W TaxID=3413045 RepID=UPI003BEFA001